MEIVEIKELDKADLLKAYTDLEIEYLEILNKLKVANSKLFLIKNALPDTNKFLWWLNIFKKVILLIIEILNYDNETTIQRINETVMGAEDDTDGDTFVL